MPLSQPNIADPLLAHLLRLPYPAFARTLATLLTTMGYQEVQLVGIAQNKGDHSGTGHASCKAANACGGKGRNSFGGLDVQAYVQTGLTRSLVIGQIKQYKEAVPRGFVDELRGTMLRLGATQGLILSTGSFAPSAHEAAQMAQHAAPVRLLDGAALAALLREQDVGLPSITTPPRTAFPAPEAEARPPAASMRQPEQQMTLTLRFRLPLVPDDIHTTGTTNVISGNSADASASASLSVPGA